MAKEKVIVAWSGGKDCALALFKIQKNYDIVALISNKHAETNRLTMHGIRETLIKQQAEALGIPIDFIELNDKTHAHYEQKLREKLLYYKSKGVKYVMHGDIFLEDLKAYRDKKLSEVGLKGLYPLWKHPTKSLVHEFYQLGFRTVICATNQANKHLLGKIVSPELIRQMAENTDPCGENGEFHSFCFQAPNFKHSIPISLGEQVKKSYTINEKTTYFYFIDILPSSLK